MTLTLLVVLTGIVAVDACDSDTDFSRMIEIAQYDFALTVKRSKSF